MAAITWSNVTDEASELLTFTNVNAQNAILNYVNTVLAVEGFGGEDSVKTFQARVFLAAHMITMLRRRGAAGIKTGQTAGPLSETFALLPLVRFGTFSTTSYGQLYAQVCRASAHRAGITF